MTARSLRISSCCSLCATERITWAAAGKLPCWPHRESALSIELRRRHVSLARLFLASFLIVASGIVSSQTGTSALPNNAYASRFGSGWEWGCDRGFMKRTDACVSVEVPANGYLDTRGNGWKCERGFRPENSTCVALMMPTNAYLDYSGNEWRCTEGFRKQDGSCVAN